jgi:zinc/manganese transport system substrate-binding protein
MKNQSKKIVLVILLLSSSLSACQTRRVIQNGLPKVVATESFLGDIAQNVAGNRIHIESLIPVTVDPHEYQPTPQDASKLAQAQVVIVNGLGYEAWLEKTLGNLGGQRQMIIASNGLTPDTILTGGISEADPHMWMDPLNVINYVIQIRDGLIQADPAGKDEYSQNASSYISELKSLNQWVKAQVAQIPVNRRLLVTNHDAMGYYARAYDFTIIGAVIPSLTTDASPSAQQMANLIDTIKNSDAPAIFLDIGENKKLAQQVASETGVKVVTDLYVESISGPTGPAPTYIDMIKYDTNVIISELK